MSPHSCTRPAVPDAFGLHSLSWVTGDVSGKELVDVANYCGEPFRRGWIKEGFLRPDAACPTMHSKSGAAGTEVISSEPDEWLAGGESSVWVGLAKHP